MADVSPSRPPSSTRQLLDELDALMQRMLALPVEDDEPVRKDFPPTSDKEALLSPPPGTLSPATPPRATAPVANPAVVPPAPANPMPAEEPSLGPRPIPPLGTDLFADLPRISSLPEHLRASSRRRRWRFAPTWERPLLWFNAAFDRGTRWLGRPGRWLRSRQGRNLLGWLGLAFLILALGWQLLAWLGWEWRFIIP